MAISERGAGERRAEVHASKHDWLTMGEHAMVLRSIGCVSGRGVLEGVCLAGKASAHRL